MKMTSYGQIANEFAKTLYKQQRHLVDALVTAGKIAASDANREWARRVAAELTKNGLEISKKILQLMK